MRHHRILPISALLLSLLCACSSVQKSNPLLDSARNDYAAAQGNAQVTTLAAPELRQAGVALQAANDAWEHRQSDDKVNQLAYVAKEKVSLSLEVARQKTAEAQIANAAKERDQMVIDQRTAEADKAKARAMQLEMSLKDLSTRNTQRGLVVTLGDVLFDTNRSELTAGGVHNVQKLASVLNQYPERNVLIEGFTDNTGSPSRNRELSEQRAEAVRSALLDMGVGPDRIVTRGYGDAHPITDNSTASGRQQNRRVEIVVSDETGKIISMQ